MFVSVFRNGGMGDGEGEKDVLGDRLTDTGRQYPHRWYPGTVLSMRLINKKSGQMCNVIGVILAGFLCIMCLS
jgi:hypothetical protein